MEFLEAAGTAVNEAARAADETDPLDDVETDLFSLGALEPVLGPDDLADLRERLRRERLLPATLVELVGLARQLAATLLEL